MKDLKVWNDINMIDIKIGEGWKKMREMKVVK